MIYCVRGIELTFTYFVPVTVVGAFAFSTQSTSRSKTLFWGSSVETSALVWPIAWAPTPPPQWPTSRLINRGYVINSGDAFTHARNPEKTVELVKLRCGKAHCTRDMIIVSRAIIRRDNIVSLPMISYY